MESPVSHREMSGPVVSWIGWRVVVLVRLSAVALTLLLLVVLIGASVLSQCGCAQPEWTCGPSSAVVKNVIDGDTIDLVSGERVRYMLVDTPELRGERGPDCFAAEAARINRDLVLGREIELRYDRECHDRYGRLLAYVSLQGVDINRRLVERGYGCVLYIPPNGRADEEWFSRLEEEARVGRRGMWGLCRDVACD